MEIPEGQVSMIIGPSGTGKSVCIKHIVGLLTDSRFAAADAELFELRKKFGRRSRTARCSVGSNLYDNVAFPLRQHTERV